MRTPLFRTLVTLVAAALTSGCSFVVRGMGSETQMSASRAARYDGDECERVLYDLSAEGDYDYNYDERKFPQHVDETPSAQILLTTCARRQKTGIYGHEIKQWPKVKDIDDEKLYLALDDRKLDIITMAVSAIRIMDDDFERYKRHQSTKWRGLARFYGEIIDRDKLAARVGKVSLPPEATQAFLTLYDDAILRARGSGLSPPEVTLFVDVPAATYKSRKAHFKKFSATYKELDELTDSAEEARTDPKAAEDAIGKLSALRGQFLAECGQPECRAQPAWANATKELALLYVAQKRAIDAMVESSMNSRQGSYVAGFAQAIRAAQEAAGQKMAEARRKYRKAKDSGVDEETALSLAGGTPGFEYSEGMLFNPKMSLPNYAAALDEKGSDYPRDTEVPVAAVQVSGATARVTFEKDTYKSEESYNCRTTNRVERIRSDGTLEYEEICNYRPTSRTVEKHAPVSIPASEAKLLRRGDSLRFIARGEEARVVDVKRDGKVIQIRGDAIGAKK